MLLKDVTLPAWWWSSRRINWCGMVTINADIRDNLKVGKWSSMSMASRWTRAPRLPGWRPGTLDREERLSRHPGRAWDAADNQADVTASGEVTVYAGNNISETNHFAEGRTREASTPGSACRTRG